jgi:hypothetical protein
MRQPGVQDYVHGSPLAGHVAKVFDESRAALVSEVGDALTSYVTGDGLKRRTIGCRLPYISERHSR